jgi:hypothetical protein
MKAFLLTLLIVAAIMVVVNLTSKPTPVAPPPSGLVDFKDEAAARDISKVTEVKVVPKGSAIEDYVDAVVNTYAGHGQVSAKGNVDELRKIARPFAVDYLSSTSDWSSLSDSKKTTFINEVTDTMVKMAVVILTNEYAARTWKESRK